jgi:hypothetical protein
MATTPRSGGSSESKALKTLGFMGVQHFSIGGVARAALGA